MSEGPESRWSVLVIVCVLITHAKLGMAYPPNRDRIPNGFNVPDPCRPGSTAQGVGHERAEGGGPLNAFGEAFRSAGSESITLIATVHFSHGY
ncbi:hypothetical protein RRG08_029285 [Elysia crispata]|uniref:Temptin Cys/Cys disulfide domain-containing protein n=1 Tax=Elysia crispata TaxID=231223 RepID=A0AAE1DSP7_9GAST|nr:hypothetical protein RRG08_029285 [Elysia crispata]